jgi:hypothetical protein
MNDLTSSKMLKGERILCNAVIDIYFTSKMKFEKLGIINQAFEKKMIYSNISGFKRVIIVVRNIRV